MGGKDTPTEPAELHVGKQFDELMGAREAWLLPFDQLNPGTPMPGSGAASAALRYMGGGRGDPANPYFYNPVDFAKRQALVDQGHASWQPGAQEAAFAAAQMSGAPGQIPVGEHREALMESGLSRSGFLQSAIAEETLGLTEEFAPRFQALQERLRQEAIQADPLSRGLQEFSLETIANQRALSGGLFASAQSGIADLDQDGLPDDIQRNIEQSTRSALTARGIEESGMGAILESLSLIGGREGLRANRIGQAQSILAGGGQAAAPGLAFASPTFAGLFGPEGQLPTPNVMGAALPAMIGAQSAQNVAQIQQQSAMMQGLGSGVGSLAGIGLMGHFGAFDKV